MTELDRGTDRAGRRSKRFLSPLQKYEIWLQLVRQEVTIAEAAAEQHVDRSTIMRIRTVAKEGALAALAASKPGVAARERDWELELAKAEVARLSEALKEMAVKLMLIEGKAPGVEWPGPAPRRGGHQGGAARRARRGPRRGLDGAPGVSRAGARRGSARTAGSPAGPAGG
jgi:transposase-like protein